MKRRTLPALLLPATAALLWIIPFAWMAVASVRHDGAGPRILRHCCPPARSAWTISPMPGSPAISRCGICNTILLCGGILAVQCVTVSLAGYAFARMRFPRPERAVRLFLLQLMLVPPILIVPNMSTLVALHLYDTLPGIAAPYCASAFGVFLMRQTFRTIPREYEEAALVDGASRLRIIFHVLLPLSRPGLAAFAIVSVTSHWNEFLWPLMATSSPSNQVLTVGLATFTAGAEAGSEWGVIAAGNVFRRRPAAGVFVLFQRRFVSTFTYSGNQVTGDHHAIADPPCPGLGCGRRCDRCRACRDRNRSVFPGAGAGQAGDGDAAPDRAVRQGPRRHPRDRRSIPAATTTPTSRPTLRSRPASRPAAVIMSANFVREYVINDEIVPFDALIAKDGADAGEVHG